MKHKFAMTNKHIDHKFIAIGMPRGLANELLSSSLLYNIIVPGSMFSM